MDFKEYEFDANTQMEKAIQAYQTNLSKVMAGRANPAVLNVVKVPYYGELTPLNEIASITSPDPKQILVKPFDISITREITNSINGSSLGINAINEGNQIRIKFPDLTTERRRELVKSLITYTEQARISIRSIRQEINKMIKDDDSLTEDDQKRYLDNIQKIVDRFNQTIEELTKAKEKELMTL